MSTVATAASPPNTVEKVSRYISFQTFLKKYNGKEDGYKYEWNNGNVEKTQSIKQDEFFILNFLSKFFYARIEPRAGGMLITEGDTWTSDYRFRKPDMAYYSEEQKKLIVVGKNALPDFVIEIISKNDVINKVYEKVAEYFDAGVKVVWLIFPEGAYIHVYSSINDILICRNDALCSAEKAVSGFSMPASDIFKKEI